ncbi:MAG: hypothetical protein A2Y41_07565 [Spirochaetes bacterium GWB1_36_13]|nr:MAG: hypothetical protein A2Y41_07565 [Spirochaetes bacterium GWB1_36_13]
MELNILQDQQARFQTEMKVDYLNKSILKGKQSNDEIQKDAFLKLLVAELKHQNPLDPMKDRDFIAQMAQMTSLEKMEKVRDGMERLISQNTNQSLYGLLGKKVHFIDDRGKQTFGAVDAVEFKENQGYLSINNNLINPKQIQKVE